MPDPAAVSSRTDYDLIIRLLTEALTVLEVDRVTARQHIILARTLALRPANIPAANGGGLAAWQMRRITQFVHFNLSTKLRIEQVASAVELSPGYLSRAFKATTGITYSEFVLQARIGLAKRLLLTTDTPICEIALACGLTDQSHLTRIFKRSVGLPPGAWRRFGTGAIDKPLVSDKGPEAGFLPPEEIAMDSAAPANDDVAAG